MKAKMGKLLEFKPRQIEPAIDRKTFLEMLLDEQKRREITKHFEEKEYNVEEFHIIPKVSMQEDAEKKQ